MANQLCGKNFYGKNASGKNINGKETYGEKYQIHIYVDFKKKINKQTHRKRDLICGHQR